MTQSSSPPQVFIFGHSHVWPVRRALNEVRGQDDDFRTKVVLCGTKDFPGSIWLGNPDGRPTLSPVLIAALNRAERTKDDWLVSMVQGNYYNQLAMVTDGPGFDFVLCDHEDLPLDEDNYFLPEAAVRAMLEHKMANFAVYARLLARYASGRSIVVGPPPPPFGEDEIRALVAQSHSDKSTIQISSPWLRLKVWRLQDKIMRDICRKNAILFQTSALDSTFDLNGFLLPEFIRDAVHANHHHAKKLLVAIDSLIASTAEAEVV